MVPKELYWNFVTFNSQIFSRHSKRGWRVRNPIRNRRRNLIIYLSVLNRRTKWVFINDFQKLEQRTVPMFIRRG